MTNTMLRDWGRGENLPLEGGDVLGDLTGEDTVVHQEEFNVVFVSDEELLETRSEHVSG